MTDLETVPVGTMAELERLREENAALAAHVGRLEEAGDSLREPWNLDEMLGASTRRRVMSWDEARRRSPTVSLSRRDALMKAEALEEFRKKHTMPHMQNQWLKNAVAEYRRQAEEEATE